MASNSSIQIKRTRKGREQLLEFCRMVGNWYINNQCTAEKPWCGAPTTADLGRFIYSYEPATGAMKANVVWGQALGIMALLALSDRLHPAGELYEPAAIKAAGYLMSLQILDQRDPRIFGAMRQSNPQTPSVHPRDASTGCMGLCVLAKRTGDEEYLYRARLIGDWYIRNALNEDRWPAYTYFHDRREGMWRDAHLWQAGAALAFYYLYRLTGDSRYIEEGIHPLMAGYKRIYKQAVELGTDKFNPYLDRTDDFSTIAAIGAYLLEGDKELLGIIRHRCKYVMDCQDEDGSCPGLAGELIAGLTWWNFIQLNEEHKLGDDVAPMLTAIAKAEKFAYSLQELQLPDVRAFGGLYGQTSYGVGRSQIHHRSCGYSILFMLRSEGSIYVPGYNVFGW